MFLNEDIGYIKRLLQADHAQVFYKFGDVGSRNNGEPV